MSSAARVIAENPVFCKLLSAERADVHVPEWGEATRCRRRNPSHTDVGDTASLGTDGLRLLLRRLSADWGDLFEENRRKFLARAALTDST
jgi:hypothetical protein